jgi:hypothetical protein
MAARPQFDPDSAYITHPRSGALNYEPLPADTLHALADIRQLQRHTQDAALLAWLDDRAAFLTADCADCPPLPVRHTEPPRQERSFPRHELRYGRRGFGPRHNASGKAKS